MENKDIMNSLLKIPEVKDLLNKGTIDKKIVEVNQLNLLKYQMKIKLCQHCEGLTKCQQIYNGHQPVLTYHDQLFDYEYQSCKYLQKEKNRLNKETSLTLIACSFDIYDFNDVYINPQRKELLAKIKEIYLDYKNGKKPKGLYIHGIYGCGKSYLLAYLAKQLVELGAEVTFAYYPDLVRQIKSSISEGLLEETINDLKEAEVLILDDFGGESLTNFIRDEVLSVILQHRMMENKLTFMSSNLSPELLRSHLSDTGRDIDNLKASRIYERIKTLMIFYELKDKNYRA